MGAYGKRNFTRKYPKAETRGFQQFDIRQPKRKGMIVSGREFKTTWLDECDEVLGSVTIHVDKSRHDHPHDHPQAFNLFYNANSAVQEAKSTYERIQLDWQECHFGGYRVWLLCPECSNRVAILYFMERFLCRSCHRLTYKVCNESALDKAQRRGERALRKLGVNKGFAYAFVNKPKGMHWRTYFRMVNNVAASKLNGGMVFNAGSVQSL